MLLLLLAFLLFLSTFGDFFAESSVLSFFPRNGTRAPRKLRRLGLPSCCWPSLVLSDELLSSELLLLSLLSSSEDTLPLLSESLDPLCSPKEVEQWLSNYIASNGPLRTSSKRFTYIRVAAIRCLVGNALLFVLFRTLAEIPGSSWISKPPLIFKITLPNLI